MNKYEKALERIKKRVEPQDGWTDEDWQHYLTICEALKIAATQTTDKTVQKMTKFEYLKEIKNYAEKIRKTSAAHHFKGGLDIIARANDIISIAREVEKMQKEGAK